MLARLHALQTTPEQHDLGLEIVRDQLLPWLRDSSGFRGLIRLWNPAESKTLVITLWADEESLRRKLDRDGDGREQLPIRSRQDGHAGSVVGPPEQQASDPLGLVAVVGRRGGQ